MHPAAQVAVAFAGVFHVLVFTVESLLFPRPTVWRRFLVASQEDAAVIRPWALNQGFYNLFLALGALTGLVLTWAGRPVTGTAVSLFACACMVLAGVVLVATDRRMLRAAAMQAVPPAAGLLLALL